MFKKSFSRYFVASALLIIICFSVISITLVLVISDFSDSLTNRDLENSAMSVSNYLEQSFSDSDYVNFNNFVYYTERSLRSNIGIFVRYSNDIRIVVTDSRGIILLSRGIFANVPERLGRDIIGEIEDKYEYSGYNTLSDMFADDYNICGECIYNAAGTVCGYVFAATGMSQMNELMNRLIIAIFCFTFVACSAIVLALRVVYARMSSPLRAMSMAAKSFAAGKYDVRIPVKGKDELTELAVTFNNMAQSIQNNEDLRSNFLASVSHDMKSPMTTISGFIDGILEGAIPPDKYKHYLSIIKDEVLRLSRLVSDLLDLSKIQAGERKFTFSTFDICEMARLIIISFEQKLESKKLDVQFITDEDSMYAFADRDAVYQILYNLCDNAIKFSREGGVLRLSVIKKVDKLYVSVYNEGIGIAENDLPYVFDRFYKADKSRGLDKSGTGLGLFIAKTIINAHNEEMWVKSISGQYCEFVFTLKSTLKAQEAENEKNN